MQFKNTSFLLKLLDPFSKQMHKFNRVKNVKSLFYSTSSFADFNPKKILILTKLSRFEFEKLRYNKLTDSELEETLKTRGADYNNLLYHHYIHKGCENRVEKCLAESGVETRIVNRFEYTDENIDWADMILTTGGDGTFLMAACRIQDNKKPVVGINTDPTRSEGYLCLPKKYSINIQDAVRKILQGKFKWTFRKRIRTTLIGESVNQKAVELHDQQLRHFEYRFFECLNETTYNENSLKQEDEMRKKRKTRVIPNLALNEAYLGECVSARVSYFEVAVDSLEKIKTKNAGVCISTGTGSTSWSYNISKVSGQTVENLFKVMEEEEGISGVSSKNRAMVERITKKYNEGLIYPSDNNKMLFNIRDPILSYTLPYALEIVPRQFAKRIEIRSRCFDACLVIDGGLSFPFNDGTVAIFEVHESDALRTIVDFDSEESETIH